MSFKNCTINITIDKKTYSIFYSYNKDTTFQDLLEYFIALVPSLNICQCYYFLINEYKKTINNQGISLNYNSKIVDYSNYLNNLWLIKNQDNNCKHSQHNNFLLSKKKIIASYQKFYEELSEKIVNQNNKINDLKQEIKNLKDYLKDYNIINKIPQEKPIDFYDAIIHIDSIKNINKGWKIEMNERGKNNIEKFKNEKILKVGIIGETNKGKTFLLSNLAKMVFPYGTKTEGISIKYPDIKRYNRRKMVFLDTASIDSPILLSKEYFDEYDRKEKFIDKYAEKFMTELFIQNYIIYNSDILIVVIGALTAFIQKLLMRVKKEVKRAKINKPLYIIHNLKKYTTKNQVENYIDNTLLKSATFTLKNYGINFTEEKNMRDVRFRFYEIQNDEKYPDIFHLIYANEDSEAGKLYNPLTLDFIEHIYQGITNLKNYDVIDTIKDRFIDIYNKIIEKKENDQNITKESFDNSLSNLIRLKNKKEIILKKCLIDEVGFSILKSNGFEPKYNIFKKDNKIIIRVELPGNCGLYSEIIVIGEYFIIRLGGEKLKDKEPENIEDNIYNFREYGKFFLDIPINSKEYNICKEEPDVKRVEGVYIIEYKLDK